MNHPLFKDHDELMPSAKDMALLPSAILKLHNLFANDKYKDSEELEGESNRQSQSQSIVLTTIWFQTPSGMSGRVPSSLVGY